MTAVGVGLILFGFTMEIIFGVNRYGYDWRDYVATWPILAGMVIAIAGVIKWLWMVAP
jgi:hypothetical protein